MVRILVCGDPGNDLVKISQKLSTLNKKSGPFQFVLLLSPPGALPAAFSPALPTYFASQEYEDSASPRQIRSNLFYVGPASNLRLQTLNLVLIAGGYDDPKSPSLPPEVESALHRSGVAGAAFRGIDVLVAPDLPRGVDIGNSTAAHSAVVAEAALRLRPRYHFASSHHYVALPPFSCPGARHATRFLALARTNAPKRDGKAPKWVYAADVTPLDMMTEAQRAEGVPKTLVRAPYLGVALRNGKLQAAAARITEEVMAARSDAQFFWNVRGRGYKRHRGGRLPARRRKARRASIETPVDAACWFCLSNEKDTHLVVDVGEHMYLALAKGGLGDDHLLIVPIDHLRSSIDARLTEDMARELDMYKKCIVAYFHSSLDGASAYFFERAVNTRGGERQMHMHINAIPILAEASRRILENAEAAAERFGIVLKKLSVVKSQPAPVLDEADISTLGAANHAEKPDPNHDSTEIASGVPGTDAAEGANGENTLSARTERVTAQPPLADHSKQDICISEPVQPAASGDREGAELGTHVARVRREVGGSDEFFYSELPCGSRLLHIQKVSEDGKGKHPLHFGRAVAAAALGRPDLVDWKNCVPDEKVEIEKAERVRERIQEFLPVLE